ncbi:cyanophycinase [Luteimonas sp. 22616]|uniref:cyanophycinase n=1 Tax=Luteimonas sp. 22616 TaxID=3453951 RepID=UPI003F84B039
MHLFAKLSASLIRVPSRLLAGVVLAACMLPGAVIATTAASPAPVAEGDGYRYYAIGDLAAARPGPVEPGLMLVGGGQWPHDAFRWMIERAGHGHIVILRASGAAEAQDEFYNDIGGVASAQTFVFSDRKAASDPAVLAALEAADGIFIAGGDQANYVRYWKGTPLNAVLDRHVRDGKPLGGTSAGLAILGAWAYGAMDGGSMTSKVALRDPLDPGMTLVADFLHLPYLGHVITDSHFAKRDRLGRLVAFVAKLRSEGVADVVGLGIDEDAALCIDGDGVGRLYPGDEGGFAWLVQPTRPPARVERGRSLEFSDVRVTGIGADSRLRLPGLEVQAPAFEKIADASHGKLVLRDAAPAARAASR